MKNDHFKKFFQKKKKNPRVVLINGSDTAVRVAYVPMHLYK